MHYRDGFSFTHAGPILEPIATEEAWLSLHMAHIKASNQGGAGISEVVKPDDGFQAPLYPR